ncbi:hypothetical protein [Blastococcus litoris]|uniref:hypothetical protein n=1 Tax=Blastococcus litoris TaxID=2171622 RepID=UPI000E3057FB|nr:hypothetical protein [Blastococcus litoris]
MGEAVLAAPRRIEEDAVQPPDQPSHPWRWLLGEWTTEATHPGLPGEVIHGRATFEWLEDQQLLVLRTHVEHDAIPDALAVIGTLDGAPAMHYFDVRGVHRVFEVDVAPGTWRYRNATPGFAQRFTGTLGPDGTTIAGQGELSRDGVIWDPDLAITYRRVG